MKVHALRLFLLAVLMHSLAVDAQKRPAIPSLGETIEVSIVDVDVIVTNRDGSRVRGLTKDDFFIFENGEPRAISNFAEYASSEEAGAATPTQTRTILLFIERTKLQPFQADPLIESIKSTLRHTIRRGDAVGLVFWDEARQIRVDFTDDLDRIDRALSSLKELLIGPPRDEEDEEISRDVREAQRQEEDRNAQAVAMEREVVGGSISVSNWSAIIERFGSMDSLTSLSRMKRKVNAINAAIKSMSSVEGKKVLVLATERLGEVARGYEYDPASDLLSVDVRQRFATSDLMDSIIQNANAIGVTVYPGYVLVREGRNTNEEAAKIARQTGGLDANGATDFVSLMSRIEDDITDYYSLAYRIDASGTDRKRDIAVKTRDPKLIVRSRKSYVEKSDQTRMKDRLQAALMRSTSDSMFLIEANFGASKKQRRSLHTLPMKVRIPIKALTVVPENGLQVGAFSVYVLTGSGGDEASAVSQQTRRFEINPTDLISASSGHFTYDCDLLLNQKADRVAVGVLDEVSKSYSVLRVGLPIRE